MKSVRYGVNPEKIKENEVHHSHERLAIIKVTFHIIIAVINSEMYISKFLNVTLVCCSNRSNSLCYSLS
jgi:hypothetical protein